MNYNELNFLAKERMITLSKLAKEIGMTLTGFKPAVEKKTLTWEKIEATCNVLQITPNEFFGWKDEAVVSGNYAAHITGGNTQNSNEAIKAMRDQLKEKDKQIDRLIRIIEKNKLTK